MYPQSTNRDWVIGRIADRQFGVVSRAQLLGEGLTHWVIRDAVRAGRLRPMTRGVYSVGHRALTRESWWMAGLLACGRGAVLSHLTAGAHWQLVPSWELPVDVITEGERGRKRPEVRARQLRLERYEWVDKGILKVTNPARTLVDLAGVLSSDELRSACERAQDKGIFHPTAVGAILELHPRRPGCHALRDLVQLLGPDEDNAWSHLERLFLKLMRADKLPLPEVNAVIEGRRRDFVWRPRRLVIETDGHRWHSSRDARSRDARRDRELTAAGWRVVRFTYDDIAFTPDRVVAEVRALLR